MKENHHRSTGICDGGLSEEKAEDEEKKRLLQELKGKENITKDGTKLTCMPTLEALGMWHRYWQ